jgi:hypothetical protein
VPVEGWTVVFLGNRIKADLLAAVFEAHGLTVEVFGDTGYGVGVDFTDARLMVPDGEAAAARRLMKQAEEAPPESEPDPEAES